MNQTTALTQAQPVGMDQWTVLKEQATMLVKTGFLPESIKTPEQAVAIILQGRELGIPTMAALQTINVIKGKPTVSPQLMLALIYRSHQLARLDIDSTDSGCSVVMDRRGVGTFRTEFTMDDARKQGLADKDNYRRQAKVMLKWRAVAACAREAFSDVVLGLYTPEEMGAEVEVTEDGGMIVTEARTITPEGEIVEAIRERQAPALEPWNGMAGELPNPVEKLNRAMGKGIDDYEPAPDNSGPATDEQKRRYIQLLQDAQELDLDVGPFEINADTITRARIIQLGSRLKAVIDAKRASVGAPA